ncbi:hypothetical protein C8J40_104424 [Sphingomonas sp. PP-CC-3A-396]|nr:hypothetical protein C8J40_104424 [Sphingomonas sp. PP-CC-3A-396]
MERFADDLVGDVRPIEVAGIDMVDTAFDRFAQDGECCVAVAWRSEHAGSGKLHGTIAEPPHVAVTEPEAACLFDRLHVVLLFPLQIGVAEARDNLALSARVVRKTERWTLILET